MGNCVERWTGHSASATELIHRERYTYKITPTNGKPYERELVVKDTAHAQASMSITDEEVTKAIELAKKAGPCNEAALQWAMGNIGTTVGNGQCSEVGDGVVGAAGAKPVRWGGAPNGQSPVWGMEKDIKEAAPGDVIQFWDCQFEGKDYHEFRGEAAKGHMHTAVCLHNVSPGVLEVLEQNIAASPLIRSKLDFNDVKSGVFTVYRLEKK